MLFPAHVAFMELIIDPACSTVFEAESEDKNIMKRPPRNLRQSIFNFKNVVISLVQGLGILLAVFILYFYVVKSGRGELEARSFAFASLVLSNLMLITVNLSWRKSIHHILLSANKVLMIVLFGTVLSLMAVLYVPFLAELFHLTPLSLGDLTLIVCVVILSLVWFEVFKIFKTKHLVLD